MTTKFSAIFIFSFSLFCTAQEFENNSDLIAQAQSDLKLELDEFFTDCLLDTDCSECVENLISHATDNYKMYIIAGALFNVDPEKSFELHERAFKQKENELNFNLEYAIELHRKGEYEEAIPYYLIYKGENKNDYRIDVWLSECYINSGDVENAIAHWKSANHPKNHTGIDKAIHTIHGSSDQIVQRSKLRRELIANNVESAYNLIYLDLNWEIDWWNSQSQDYFLREDLELIEKSFGSKSEVYRDASLYANIKLLAANRQADSIKTALSNSGIIINGNRLLPNGKLTSDILRISFTFKIMDELDFFKSRKNDILELADRYKDGELLNIYAYLEAVVNGKVSKETDKKGWYEFHDERFAVSYFFGLAEENKYDNPDLKQALSDFPNSARIQWVKLNCAVIEDLDFREDLIELIQKDFKTLESDRSRYSYGLKSYFHLLENGKG